MNTNDDFNNKRLLDEIDGLENDSVIKMKENDIKSRPGISVESIILITLIIAVIIGGVYVYYNSNDGHIMKSSEILEFYETYDNNSEGIGLFDDDEYFTGVDVSENESYEQIIERAEDKFAKQKENLVVSQKVMNVNKQLIVCLENKNQEIIYDIDVYAVFYDGENNIVGIDKDGIDVINFNSKKYILFYETPETFERYDIFISKTYFETDNYIELLNDKIEYSDGIVDDKIEINFKNNADKLVDAIRFSIVYYDENNNILDIEETIDVDIKKNKSGTINAYGIWNELTNEKVKYDHYEVILNSAISYNY